MAHKSTSEELLPENCFREGDYLFTLTEEGVFCSRDKGDKETLLPYAKVRFYRAVQRRNSSDIGRAKLYFTAEVPSSRSSNRYSFQRGGVQYLTHEFSDREKGKMERCLARFPARVTDRRVRNLGIPKPRKNFSEDGGFSRKVLVGGIAFFAALLLGAVIMILLNYFLHTNTESMAMVFGIFCVPCLAAVLIKSQELGSRIKVYDKGVFLKIRTKSGEGFGSPFATYKAFFTWDEVERIERVQSQVQYFVRFRLGYCVYSVPDFNGLYAYLAKCHPEKCREGEGEEA